MKKSYNAWWSETADNDLVSIIEYIAGENPLQASKIFGDIKKVSMRYLSADEGFRSYKIRNYNIS